MANIKPCVECGTNFEFKTHNQKYCSDKCCRTSTNKRIMQKYYAKKERLAGKVRLCSCGSPLSMYNSDVSCQSCQSNKRNRKPLDAREAIRNAIIKSAETKSE